MVNDEQRKTYYMVQQELVTISTVIGPGEHTVVFRVENAEFDPGVERVVSQFGTGRVRLDDCEVSNNVGLVTAEKTASTGATTANATLEDVILNSNPTKSPTENQTGGPTESPTDDSTESPTDD